MANKWYFFLSKSKTTDNGLSLHEKSKLLKPMDTTFNPDLTKNLQDEHLSIVSQLERVNNLFRKERFESARSEIRSIVNTYFVHSTKKQSSLYTFIESAFRSHPKFIKLMKRYRKQLGICNNEMLFFFNRWTRNDLSTGGLEFQNDLAKAKEGLISLHQIEVTNLYKFYDDHSKIKLQDSPQFEKQAEANLDEIEGLQIEVDNINLGASEELTI